MMETLLYLVQGRVLLWNPNITSAGSSLTANETGPVREKPQDTRACGSQCAPRPGGSPLLAIVLSEVLLIFMLVALCKMKLNAQKAERQGQESQQSVAREERQPAEPGANQSSNQPVTVLVQQSTNEG